MNVLFITPTDVGDAVLTTGVLAQLVRRYPIARITVACGAAAMPLFAAAPNVDRRIVMVERKGAIRWFELWRECLRPWWGWGLIVDLRGSLLAHFLIARRRRVYRGETAGRHRLYGLAKAMRFSEPPAPCVWTTAADETEAARLVPDGGPVLALGPAARRRDRIWPAADSVALARRLAGPDGILPDARIAVFGGTAGERDVARPLLDDLPAERRIDLGGAADLPTLAAALGRCALFVGDDVGLMHLAAAVGTPTLGLLGSDYPETRTPWGAGAATVRATVRAGGGTAEPTTGLDIDEVETAAVALWQRCSGL